MQQRIARALPARHPWRESIHYYDTIGSTNDLALQMARAGAPAGTIVVAGSQTGGHGRMGRSFCSPAGMGVYLSCILRPNCPPEQLLHLTCGTAVAAMDAVERVCGLRPGIKWTNDLVIGPQKLGGILTSLQIDPATGLAASAIVGIGINCRQRREDFPPELRETACSLAMHVPDAPPEALAAALIETLWELDGQLPGGRAALMARYRENCVTLGKAVSWQAGDQLLHGTAESLEEDGSLVLRLPDGTVRRVCFGEVSVRGMYGYL